jgi:pimeloyl-ACP methyl ester carboxylesterase
MNCRSLARLLIVAATFIACILFGFAQGGASPWHDPSMHSAQFVTVDEGVRLEVLDWGGIGRNIVLLAGSGNTAHVFDDFAQKLTRTGHVYGITRRGFGASSHAESGYHDQRLADDVLRVLDASGILKPVLVGHSLAGSEMTTLGSQHSDRLAGLVYLDAGDDPGDYPGDPAYSALFEKLPPSVTRPPRAPAEDRKSFQAYQDWQTRTTRFAYPESELRQMFDANPDGSVGPLRARGPISKPVSQAIGEGSKKRDYSTISVPILYLPAAPPRANGWSQYYRFTPANDSERMTLQKIYDADRINLDRYEKSMQRAQGKVRIVELRGADHYVYFTNESSVLRELRKFVVDLR